MAGRLLLLRVREDYFCCARASTTEYNIVAWGGQTRTTSYNIAENKRNIVLYNICLVKSLIVIKLYTTRYNKMAKRVQHFIKHQSCMMLYEMLYSFGWGLMQKHLLFDLSKSHHCIKLKRVL